jgi:hypothetical protein
LTYRLLLRSCKLMGAFVISPLPPVLLEPLQTAGPLGSTDITLFLRYYGPLRHPLAGPRLPGVAGYTVPFSADFATGRGGLLQLLSASLPSCCRCNPARVSRPISQSANDPCCLRPMKKGSAPGIPFRGYVCVHSLRPDDSLTILAMASSIGSQDSVSFLLTIQATGLLTFTLVGLPPTEIRQPSLDTPPRRFIPTLSLQVCSPPRSFPPLSKLRQGSRGFYVRAEHASLPPHASDMLAVRIQAIDGEGTFTLQDSQPYRLLNRPLPNWSGKIAPFLANSAVAPNALRTPSWRMSRDACRRSTECARRRPRARHTARAVVRSKNRLGFPTTAQIASVAGASSHSPARAADNANIA